MFIIKRSKTLGSGIIFVTEFSPVLLSFYEEDADHNIYTILYISNILIYYRDSRTAVKHWQIAVYSEMLDQFVEFNVTLRYIDVDEFPLNPSDNCEKSSPKLNASMFCICLSIWTWVIKKKEVGNFNPRPLLTISYKGGHALFSSWCTIVIRALQKAFLVSRYP